MQDLVIIPKEFSEIEKSDAIEIENAFKPMVSMLKEMEKEYSHILSVKDINEGVCKDARELRLRIVKTRTTADKVREEKKKIYLIKGNAIQGFYNIFLAAVVEKEKNLKNIEEHFERLEAEKKQIISEKRADELFRYDYHDIDGLKLGDMTEDFWNKFLLGIKTEFETKKAEAEKLEKEKLAKEKADKEEQERMILENENLKAEAEAREKALEIERAEAKRKQDELEAKARAEAEARERLEAEAKKKQEDELRAKIESENKLTKEKEEKDKAEKNKKYIKFLEKNNFNKEIMEVRQEGNTFTIWEKIDSITI